MENKIPANAENVAEVTTVEDTNVSDVEFSDTAEATEVASEEPAETLAERNRKAYEMRQARKQSKAKVETETKKETKRESGLINSFTGQPIETDEDMEDFKLMQTIENEGGDAILDFPKYLRNKRKQVADEIAAQKQSTNNNEALMQELDVQLGNIKETLGVDAEDLYSKNKAFREFANEMIDDGVPLKSIVKTWQKFETKNHAEIERRARDLLSKGNAIPPIQSAAPPATKSVSEMTIQEFEEYKRKVKMGEI